jgi:hypothetical protein
LAARFSDVLFVLAEHEAGAFLFFQNSHRVALDVAFYQYLVGGVLGD